MRCAPVCDREGGQTEFLAWPLRRSHVASTTCGDPINHNTVSLALGGGRDYGRGGGGGHYNNNSSSGGSGNKRGDDEEEEAVAAGKNAAAVSPYSRGVVLVTTAVSGPRIDTTNVIRLIHPHTDVYCMDV